MKFLFIQPTGDKFGHYGTHFVNIAQALCKLGHDVTIYTNKLDAYKYTESQLLFKIVEYRNGMYPFANYEIKKVSNPFNYWLNYFSLSFKITNNGIKFGFNNNFDAIYISDAEFLMASIALAMNSKNRQPILMQINASNFSFDEYPGSILKKIYKSFQTFWLRKAIKLYIEGITILGEWHDARLRRQLKLGKDYSIFKIPDGATQFKHSISKNRARKILGIDQNCDVLLFLGILRIDKGLEVLAEALRLVFEEKNFKVIIAGHPYDYSPKELRKMFETDDKNRDLIRMDLKYIEECDLANYYRCADALLLPYNSKYKGSSGPLMKGACSFGLPVILSDQGEMGTLSRKHDLGFLFEPENPTSLAKAITDFLDASNVSRSKKTSNALALGKLNSWESIAKAYENALKSIQNTSGNKIGINRDETAKY